jgi:hypothetical protein
MLTPGAPLVDLDLGFPNGIAHGFGAVGHVAADDYLFGCSGRFFDDGLFVPLNDVELSRRHILVCRRIRPGRPALDDHSLVRKLTCSATVRATA